MDPISVFFIAESIIPWDTINGVKKFYSSCIQFVSITSDRELSLNGLAVSQDLDLILLEESESSDSVFLSQIRSDIPVLLLSRKEPTRFPSDRGLPSRIVMVLHTPPPDGENKILQFGNAILFIGNMVRKLEKRPYCCGREAHRTLQPDIFSILKEVSPINKTPSFSSQDRIKKLIDDPKLEALPFIRPLVLAIGISTGGPETLKTLFSGFPANFPAPILLVQHIPEYFIDGFISTINSSTDLRVEPARDHQVCKPGVIYISPGNYQLGVFARKIAGIKGVEVGTRLFVNPREQNGHCPSVGFLFDAIAEAGIGNRTVALLMTGMGDDGAHEIGKIKMQNGITLVQDKDSSTVYGMAKVAAEEGHIHREVPLSLLPDLIGYFFRCNPTKSSI